MLSSNVPTFLTAVPQRRTFATTFLPPQLPLTFERQVSFFQNGAGDHGQALVSERAGETDSASGDV